MMMRNITILLVILFVSGAANAKELNDKNKNPNSGTIEGQVFDIIQKIPIEFANVVLFNQRDSLLFTGDVTDDKGTFEIENVPEGEYKLQVSIVGYESRIVHNLRINAQNHKINLDKVTLQPSAVMLQGAQVNGEKSSVEFQIDKKVVNVSKDITASGGTAIDVLQKQSSVQVDQDGNITLRGSSNFTVQVNGRPGPLQGNDALRQIPANMIESIEIITNPSAKYDAEGSAGIINIIMKKQQDNNLNGVVNAGVGSRNKYNGDFTLNYRSPAFGVNGGMDYRNWSNTMNQKFQMQTILNNDTRLSGTELGGKFKRENYNIKGGVDFYITDKNTLTFNLSGGKVNFLRDFSFKYNELYNVSDALKYTTTDDIQNLKVGYFNSSVYYNHSIVPDVHEIVLDASLNVVDLPTLQTSDEYITDATYQNQIANPLMHSVDNNSGKIESTIKLNYSYKIAPKRTFEMGVQSNLYYKNTDFIDRQFDFAVNNWIVNPDVTNNFDFRNNIYAGFATYTDQLIGFDYQLGLRSEYTDRMLTQNSLNQNFKYGKLDLFPSFYLTRNLAEGEQIQFNFSRRINRPWEWSLNPFQNLSLSYVSSYGNPRLLPEFTNSFELNYQKNFKAVFFSAQTYLRQTNNSITQTQSIKDGIVQLTFANLAKTKNYGAELSSNITFTSWLKIDPTINLFQYNMDGVIADQLRHENIFTWTGRLNATISFTQDMRLQIFTNYSAKNITSQGDVKPIYFLTFALRKEFFEKKLIATLQVQNAFNTIRYRFSSSSENFLMNGNVRPEAPVVNLTFNFNFNNFKGNKRGNGDVDINVNPGL